MKTLRLLALGSAILLTISCEKPASEAERNAQVEREVQQRLATERQADDQKRIDQQKAELDAREQALANKEATPPESAASAATPADEAEPEQAEAPQGGEVADSSADDGAARSYDVFYNKLEPYGAWRETNDYGFVWQPRVAQSRDWRPYTDGRWAYTDAGWTWISNEPFGWATFHYGRWTRLRGVGWVWVPGEEWAPAWVSWRTSDQHVGWAPLPPEARFERGKGIKKWADSYYDISADEYVFIPNEDIGAENVGRAVIPADRNVTIVNETTNVTNITYNNRTIVNEGPNYEQLRGRSRRPVERLHLQREYNIEKNQAPQSTVRGGNLAIMTPLFSARSTERPRNTGAPIGQATVERNWTGDADRPEAQRARAKMKSEATPPSDAPSKRFEKPVVAAAPPASAAPRATPNKSTPAAAVTASPARSIPKTIATAPPAKSTPIPTATVPPVRSTPIIKATSSPVGTATPRSVHTPRATPSAPAATTPKATPLLTPTPAAAGMRTPMPPTRISPAARPSATAVLTAPKAIAPRAITPPVPPKSAREAVSQPVESTPVPKDVRRPATAPVPSESAPATPAPDGQKKERGTRRHANPPDGATATPKGGDRP